MYIKVKERKRDKTNCFLVKYTFSLYIVSSRSYSQAYFAYIAFIFGKIYKQVHFICATESFILYFLSQRYATEQIAI